MAKLALKLNNEMWFKRGRNGKYHYVRGTNETLQVIMNELFANDDYYFHFAFKTPFANAQPVPTNKKGEIV